MRKCSLHYLFTANAEGLGDDLNKSTVTERKLRSAQVSYHLTTQIATQHLINKQLSLIINLKQVKCLTALQKKVLLRIWENLISIINSETALLFIYTSNMQKKFNLQILKLLYKGKICSDYNLSSGAILPIH